MFKKIKKQLKHIWRRLVELVEREDNCLSIGRITALFTWIMWVYVTLFLLHLNRTWAHYDTLSAAAFGLLLIQIGNKAVECKLFTVKTDLNSINNSGITRSQYQPPPIPQKENSNSSAKDIIIDKVKEVTNTSLDKLKEGVK